MTGKWKPIDTARALVYGSKAGVGDKPPIGFAKWVKSEWNSWEDDGPRRKKLVTTDSSGWECDEHLYEPTHWMPLPEFPCSTPPNAPLSNAPGST